MSNTSFAYPVFLDLRNRLAIVIGGGSVGERKARALLKHGADVAVITPDPTPGLIEAETDGLLTIERRAYERGDLTGAFVAICVEPADDVRRAVFAEAEERGCLVSAVDAPDSSNFSTPSVVRRGVLQIAISTAGLAPAIAKQIRARLQEEYGEEWAAYVSLLGELRGLLVQRMPTADHRAILESAAASDLLDRIRDGHAPDAEALFAEFVPVELASAETEPESAEAEPESAEAPAADTSDVQDAASSGKGASA